MVKIWRHEGALGFFKGCVPNVLKMAPAAAITFIVYEEVLAFLGSGAKEAGGSKPPPA
jgi:solute carrier family 25 (mitochondrial folate transporter), member 32